MPCGGIASGRNGRDIIRAFAQHELDTIAGNKAPSLGIDRILLKSENGGVVVAGLAYVLYRNTCRTSRKRDMLPPGRR
jgi:hypothetical protein